MPHSQDDNTLAEADAMPGWPQRMLHILCKTSAALKVAQAVGSSNGHFSPEKPTAKQHCLAGHLIAR